MTGEGQEKPFAKEFVAYNSRPDSEFLPADDHEAETMPQFPKVPFQSLEPAQDDKLEGTDD